MINITMSGRHPCLGYAVLLVGAFLWLSCWCGGRASAQVLTASASTSPVSVKRRTGELCVSTMIKLCNSDQTPPAGTGGGSSCPNTGTLYHPICAAHTCIICSGANNNIQGFCIDIPNSVCKQDGTAQCGDQMVGSCGPGTNADGRPVCICGNASLTSNKCIVETCVPD